MEGKKVYLNLGSWLFLSSVMIFIVLQNIAYREGFEKIMEFSAYEEAGAVDLNFLWTAIIIFFIAALLAMFDTEKNIK